MSRSGKKELLLPDTGELPLREAVYQSLRKAILTGELSPDERLTEMELGKKLRTSRTPIREALRKLELEGLVVIVPRSGAKVAPISPRQLREVLEVRKSMDELCVRLACRRITPDQKEALKDALRRFETAVREGDKMKIAGADVDFHDRITEAAANEKLQQIMNTLADQIYRYRYEYIKEDHYYDRLIGEHREICGSIINGDEEKAAETSGIHVNNQELSIMKSLGLEAD